MTALAWVAVAALGGVMAIARFLLDGAVASARDGGSRSPSRVTNQPSMAAATMFTMKVAHGHASTPCGSTSDSPTRASAPITPPT